MKLLLTSEGLTNNSIINALFDLTGKKPEDTTVVFIPTASNAVSGDKDWLITHLMYIKELNFKSIEITDISAIDEDLWKSSLEKADVLFFEGGSVYHLMRWLNKSKLSEQLPQLLENKVYVGGSAGSMVTCPDLKFELLELIYEEDILEKEELKGLNFIDFYVLPHLNNEYFWEMKRENVEKVGAKINKPIYALDDNSALKIDNGKVEIISEGEWFVINT